MAPAQISELATAVATVDLESGSRRNVRRLLKLAIKEPTENALAQVEWAERDSTADLELEAIVNRTPDAYEASCWVKYNEGQIEAALAAAREWQLDETFATRPVGMVCYLAAFLDDYATVIHSARAALATHPDEVLHRNNLAYALLSQGRILDSGNGQELVEYIDYIRKRVNAREIDALQATANAGLLFYRLGRLEEGKQLYEAAMSAAEKFGDHLVRAHAAVMNAREAILFRAKWATEALATAHKLTKRIASPGLVFYLRKLNSLIKDPDLHAQVLSPQSAGRFETTKRIVDPFKDLRIEQTESGPVLWVPRHLMKK
jgi:tetratricopeptide (TPR) repeat protein